MNYHVLSSSSLPLQGKLADAENDVRTAPSGVTIESYASNENRQLEVPVQSTWPGICKRRANAKANEKVHSVAFPVTLADSSPYWTQSIWVGISSFFYLFPACTYTFTSVLAARSSGPSDYSWCLLALGGLYFTITLTSFFADFLFIPVPANRELQVFLSKNPSKPVKKDTWGFVDRIFASSGCVLSVLESWFRAGPVITLVCFLTCAAFFVLSRFSRSHSAWIIRHSLWHIVSSSVVAVNLLFFKRS